MRVWTTASKIQERDKALSISPRRAAPTHDERAMWPLLLLPRHLALDRMRKRHQEVVEELLHDGAASDFMLNDILRMMLKK